MLPLQLAEIKYISFNIKIILFHLMIFFLSNENVLLRL